MMVFWQLRAQHRNKPLLALRLPASSKNQRKKENHRRGGSAPLMTEYSPRPFSLRLFVVAFQETRNNKIKFDRQDFSRSLNFVFLSFAHDDDRRVDSVSRWLHCEFYHRGISLFFFFSYLLFE
jgi:hypothetical protein